MMRLAHAEALFEADGPTAVLVENLRLPLNEHSLEQHLAGMLSMHQDRGYPPGLIVAVKPRHGCPKRFNSLGL
ncbi:hypothetical protein D3C71_1849210 [compost metagenome]